MRPAIDTIRWMEPHSPSGVCQTSWVALEVGRTYPGALHGICRGVTTRPKGPSGRHDGHRGGSGRDRRLSGLLGRPRGWLWVLDWVRVVGDRLEDVGTAPGTSRQPPWSTCPLGQPGLLTPDPGRPHQKGLAIARSGCLNKIGTESSVRCAWATPSPSPCNRDTLHTTPTASGHLAPNRGTTLSRKGNCPCRPSATPDPNARLSVRSPNGGRSIPTSGSWSRTMREPSWRGTFGTRGGKSLTPAEATHSTPSPPRARRLVT